MHLGIFSEIMFVAELVQINQMAGVISSFDFFLIWSCWHGQFSLRWK
jgi:hypothetical protein